jgi:hypothetical protein
LFWASFRLSRFRGANFGLWWIVAFAGVSQSLVTNRGVNDGETRCSCGDLLVGNDSKTGMKNGTPFGDYFAVSC